MHLMMSAPSIAHLKSLQHGGVLIGIAGEVQSSRQRRAEVAARWLSG
jgi:hypothetical protein